MTRRHPKDDVRIGLVPDGGLIDSEGFIRCLGELLGRERFGEPDIP